MVDRPNDIQTVGEQAVPNFVEQPVASSESTNEHNMLELKFKVKDFQRNKRGRRTKIRLRATLHWSNTAFTIHSTEGSKNFATSDPRSLSWPNRILQLGSLSLVPPNLIY